MNKIESQKPIHLTIPESSTVIVIPKGHKETPSQVGPTLLTSERWRVERYISVSVLRRATQEILDHGNEAELDRSTTDLVLAMIEARRNNLAHEDFAKFLSQNFRRMQYQLGYSEPRLDEAKEQISNLAEIVWTATTDEELDEILRAQTVPFPQKLQ